MEDNVSDRITEKLTEIERSADELTKSNSVENIGNLKRSLKDFFDFVPELVDKCEPSQAINVIDLFYLFCTKYRFDSLLNTGINYQVKILYYKAFLLQAQWVLDQLSDCLLEMENVFADELKLDTLDFFDQPSPLEGSQKQIISKHSLRKLNYSLLYVECLLQHAALLSQKNENAQAKAKAEQCYRAIQAIIAAVNRMADVVTWAGPENFNLNSGVKLKAGEVFRYIKYLKDFGIPSDTEDNTKWSLEIAQWKLNKDLTDKLLMKKIEGPIAHRCLKQKIDKEWCNSFHISNVVKMSSFKEFDEKLNVCEISEDLVCRLVLMFACCIFSLAAENRFIVKKDIESQEEDEKQNTAKRPAKQPQADYSHEFKLQKSKPFIYSEKVHMKAIELLLFGFNSDIRLIKHLLSSYKKNYSFNILLIEEEDEPSFSTCRKSEYFDTHLQNLAVSESSNLECLNELNKRFAKIADNKRDNGMLIRDMDKTPSTASNRQTPVGMKTKMPIHKLRLDIKDLSPKFYKNLNPKFLAKTNFAKKQHATLDKNSLARGNGKLLEEAINKTQQFKSNRENNVGDAKPSDINFVDTVKFNSNSKVKGNATEPLNKHTVTPNHQTYLRELQRSTNRSGSQSNTSINLTTEKDNRPRNDMQLPKSKFSSKFTKLLTEMNEDLKKQDDGKSDLIFTKTIDWNKRNPK